MSVDGDDGSSSIVVVDLVSMRRIASAQVSTYEKVSRG